MEHVCGATGFGHGTRQGRRGDGRSDTRVSGVEARAWSVLVHFDCVLVHFDGS